MFKKETELLNSWLWDKHKTDLQWKHQRLGEWPSKEEARMYSVLLRWVDAIVIKDNVVYIIEAKLRPKADAIGQLDLYERLFRKTPEFKKYWGYPIKKVLLTQELDKEIKALCDDKGIIYEIYP